MNKVEKQTSNNLQGHLLPRFKPLIDLMENLKEVIQKSNDTINQEYKEYPYWGTIGLVSLTKDMEIKNQTNQNRNYKEDSSSHGWCSSLGQVLFHIFVHLLATNFFDLVISNKVRHG